MNFSDIHDNPRSTAGLSDSVRKTLFNTFVAVGAMMAITGVASFFSLGLKLNLVTMLALFVASIGVIIATHFMRNSAFGLVLLAVFSAIQGVVLGPVLNHYLEMRGGTAVVASAAGLTALAAFACASYAITSKRDFSRWGGFLFGATLVLIVASLLSMFFPMPGMQLLLAAVTAVLFLGWLLFDIGSILNGTQTNYIPAALSIYLDLLNIFTSLLRLLGVLPGSDD